MRVAAAQASGKQTKPMAIMLRRLSLGSLLAIQHRLFNRPAIKR